MMRINEIYKIKQIFSHDFSNKTFFKTIFFFTNKYFFRTNFKKMIVFLLNERFDWINNFTEWLFNEKTNKMIVLRTNEINFFERLLIGIKWDSWRKNEMIKRCTSLLRINNWILRRLIWREKYIFPQFNEMMGY